MTTVRQASTPTSLDPSKHSHALEVSDALDESVTQGDWKSARRQLRVLLEVLPASADALTAQERQALTASVVNAREAARVADQPRTLELVGSILALGIPFIVDELYESPHERLADDLDRLERATPPVNVETPPSSKQQLAEALRPGRPRLDAEGRVVPPSARLQELLAMSPDAAADTSIERMDARWWDRLEVSLIGAEDLPALARHVSKASPTKHEAFVRDVLLGSTPSVPQPELWADAAPHVARALLYFDGDLVAQNLPVGFVPLLPESSKLLLTRHVIRTASRGDGLDSGLQRYVRTTAPNLDFGSRVALIEHFLESRPGQFDQRCIVGVLTSNAPHRTGWTVSTGDAADDTLLALLRTLDAPSVERMTDAIDDPMARQELRDTLSRMRKYKKLAPNDAARLERVLQRLR